MHELNKLNPLKLLEKQSLNSPVDPILDNTNFTPFSSITEAMKLDANLPGEIRKVANMDYFEMPDQAFAITNEQSASEYRDFRDFQMKYFKAKYD